MLWFLSQIKKKGREGGITNLKWLMKYAHQIDCVDLVWILTWTNLLLKKDKLRQEDLNMDTPKLLLTLLGDKNIVAR